MIAHIQANPEITIQEIAEQCGLTERGFKTQISTIKS
ncbi:AsnC family protein [Methanocalculus taiwanensis]|uniref:AsnC family protein n=1 Tax=Methanocalculus taiwanensis TaxID=106207 RepID=A0ABD4TKS7_9EURY|nr:AsnC family protein [Methanocalculus taiwanensis]